MEPEKTIEYFSHFGPVGIVLFLAYFFYRSPMGNPGYGPPPKPHGKRIEKWFVREPLAAAINWKGEVQIEITFETTDTKPRRIAAVIQWYDEIGRCEDIVYLDELEHEVTYEPLVVPEKRTKIGAAYVENPWPTIFSGRNSSVPGPAPRPESITLDARIAIKDMENTRDDITRALRENAERHRIITKMTLQSPPDDD